MAVLRDLLCETFYPGYYIVVVDEQVLTKERADFYLGRIGIETRSKAIELDYNIYVRRWELVKDPSLNGNCECNCYPNKVFDPKKHGILIIETNAWVAVLAQNSATLEDILSMSSLIAGSVNNFFDMFKNAALISVDLYS